MRHWRTLLVLLALLSAAVSNAESFSDRLVAAALERTQHAIVYNGAYVAIDYPNGDVPPTQGVCTDVVIRSYRGVGVDLQQAVHEDMRRAFNQYPSKRLWGLQKPDTNIDHRRVPNLQTFFTRQGESIAVTRQGADYLPGDVVTWMLPGNLPHIGIVTNKKSRDGLRPLIVHNIGAGPTLEDMLFDYTITGHYRYQPALN